MEVENPDAQAEGVVEFARYDDAGRILFVGSAPATMLHLQGEQIVIGRADPRTQFVAGGRLKNYTPAELEAQRSLRPGFEWRMPERAAVDARSLEDAKAEAWERIKRGRAEREAADFECDGDVYQANQEALTSAALQALQDAAYSVAWRLSNNDLRLLSASDVQAVCAALYKRNAALRALADALRVEVDNAADVGEADAVAWPD